MAKEKATDTYRLDVNLPRSSVDILEELAKAKGENKTETIKGSLRLSKKVHDLIEEGKAVLATKDETGKLTEFAPLSILE